MKRFVFHIMALVMALVLIIALSAASFIFDKGNEAQAIDYEEVTTLMCVWPDNTIEFFILDGLHKINATVVDGWTVIRIYRYENSIDVRIVGPNNETLNISFNNGWPCRVETMKKPIQSESDTFTPLDYGKD